MIKTGSDCSPSFSTSFLVVIIFVMVVMIVMRSRLVNDRIESVMFVGGVVHRSNGTVRFDQRILSLHDISLARLVLRLHVSGMIIIHAVFEGVLGRRLHVTEEIA